MQNYHNRIPRIPRILTIMPTVQKACRYKVAGILKYARLYGPWDVQLYEKHPHVAQLAAFVNWRPDGIITCSDPLDPEFHLDANLPCVALDTDVGEVSRASVTVNHDSHAIAHCVAEHFLQLGLKNFAFVNSLDPASWSTQREVAFTERVQGDGHRFFLYTPQNIDDWGIEQQSMATWLRSLPKPCGIMVANDRRAKQVIDTCLAIKINVPHQLAIAGVDNDEMICENTTPTLSSVLPDFEGGGMIAAKALDQILHGKSAPCRQLTYGIKAFHQRASTAFFPHANQSVSAALEFIRLNAAKGIAVQNVVNFMKVSRRYAERHFQTALGRTILEEIQTQRLLRVCAMLKETDLPVGEIGWHCGYQSDLYLKNLFKKRFGMTMREYRNHFFRNP